MANHILRDGHVDVGPDGLSHRNVITKLRLTQHAVLVGLVVAGPQNCPVRRLRVVGALHNRIVLNSVSHLVHRHALLQSQRNDVRIRLAGHGRLEGRRSTVARLGNALEVGRHHGRCVLARQRLAGIQNVGAAVAGHIQSALEHVGLQHRIVALAWLVAKQEVNAILVRGLPLVHTQPRVATTVLHWSHSRGLWREDQPVCRVSELGVQQGVDGLLHHGAVPCEEHLGLNPQRLLARSRHKVATKVLDKLPSTAQAACGGQVLIRQHQRQAGGVLASEGVDIKDAEQIQVRQVLAIQHVADVNILGGGQPSPRDAHVRGHANDPLVRGHNQKAAVSVSLVRDRVALQDRVGAHLAHVAAVHGHRVDELESQALEAHAVVLHIRLGQQEGRTLKGLQDKRHVAEQGVHDSLGGCLAVKHLQLQFVSGLCAHHLVQAAHAPRARLDEREVKAQQAVQRGPRTAVNDADVGGRVHRRTCEITAQLLLAAEGEADTEVGEVHQIGLRPASLKVAGLALNEQFGSAEVSCRADLVDICRLCDDDPNIVGVREDGAVFLSCRAS